MEEFESSYVRIYSEIFLKGKNLNNPLIVSYNIKKIDPLSVNYNKRIFDPLFIKYKKRGWVQMEDKEEEKQRRKNKKNIKKCM